MPTALGWPRARGHAGCDPMRPHATARAGPQAASRRGYAGRRPVLVRPHAADAAGSLRRDRWPRATDVSSCRDRPCGQAPAALALSPNGLTPPVTGGNGKHRAAPRAPTPRQWRRTSKVRPAAAGDDRWAPAAPKRPREAHTASRTPSTPRVASRRGHGGCTRGLTPQFRVTTTGRRSTSRCDAARRPLRRPEPTEASCPWPATRTSGLVPRPASAPEPGPLCSQRWLCTASRPWLGPRSDVPTDAVSDSAPAQLWPSRLSEPTRAARRHPPRGSRTRNDGDGSFRTVNFFLTRGNHPCVGLDG